VSIEMDEEPKFKLVFDKPIVLLDNDCHTYINNAGMLGSGAVCEGYGSEMLIIPGANPAID